MQVFSTLDGASVSVADEAILAFSGNLQGDVIRENDAGYEEARLVWNRSFSKRPAMIARCRDADDVVASINFAREHNLLVAVRCGAHNVAGNSVCEGGLVIDLGPMNTVDVDLSTKRVKVGGGCQIGTVDQATQEHGLAVPLGIVSKTGIGGLTLCGGHSWLARKYGFACDNLLGVQIVTADGRLLAANERENADLFWAVRGGGGNFGVVTEFEYQAHPVGPGVTLCAPFFPLEDAGVILRKWRDYMQNAPDEFTPSFVIWSVPEHENFPAELHGRAVAIPAGVHCGPPDEAAAFIQPIREFGEPLLDISGPIPYLGVQQAFDPFFEVKGERFNYWKSLYMDELSDEAIDRIVQRALNRPNPWSLIPIRLMGGASGRVPSDATALGGRDANFMLSIDTSWTDPADTGRAVTWSRDFWEEMRAGSAGRIYLNFVGEGEDTEPMLRASYGDANYERLVEIKTKYDPQNLFRLNQNIKPKQ